MQTKTSHVSILVLMDVTLQLEPTDSHNREGKEVSILVLMDVTLQQEID